MTDIFGFLSFYYVFYFYPPFFCVLLLIAFFWIILIFIIPFLLYSLANILFLVVLRGCIMQTCKSNYFKFYFSASLIMPESHSFTYQPHVSHGCHAFYSTHTLNFTIIVLNNLFVLTHIVILPLFLIPSCISMFWSEISFLLLKELPLSISLSAGLLVLNSLIFALRISLFWLHFCTIFSLEMYF